MMAESSIAVSTVELKPMSGGRVSVVARASTGQSGPFTAGGGSGGASVRAVRLVRFREPITDGGVSVPAETARHSNASSDARDGDGSSVDSLPGHAERRDGRRSGHTKMIACCGLSRDRTRLITGSRDSTMRVWNAETGSLLTERNVFGGIVRGHSEAVEAVAMSPSGTWCVSSSWDNTARVWDLELGTEVCRLKHATSSTSSGFSAVTFSPDGRLVGAASTDPRKSVAGVWDATTGELLTTLEGHTGHVQAMSFSPNGTRIVTGSRDGTCIVHQLRSNLHDLGPAGHVSTLVGHSEPIVACKYSPVQRGGGSRHSSIAATTDKRGSVVDAGAGGGTSDYASIVLTAALDGMLGVWDAATGALVRSLYGMDRGVKLHCDFSPDGSQVAGVSALGVFFLWDVASGAVIRRVDLVQMVSVNEMSHARGGAAQLSGHASGAASAGGARGIAVLAGSDRQAVSTSTGIVVVPATHAAGADGGGSGSSAQATAAVVAASIGVPLSIAFTTDGRRILIPLATDDYGLRLVDTQIEPVPLVKPHVKSVTACAFHPSGSRIISASVLGPVRVWDATTGADICELDGHTHSVMAVCVSVDGSRYVTASWDRLLMVWDAATGKRTGTLTGHEGQLSACALSPAHAGGRIVASGSSDSTVRIWDADSGICTAVLSGHKGAVNAVSFSHTGEYLASGSFDATIRVWNPVTRALLVTFHGHSSSVHALTFYPAALRGTGDLRDGLMSGSFAYVDDVGADMEDADAEPTFFVLASASTDRSVRLWSMSTRERNDSDATAVVSAEQVHVFEEAHLGTATSCAFSPAGSRLFTVGRDKTLKVWDLSDFSCEMAFKLPAEGECVSCFGGQPVASVALGTMRRRRMRATARRCDGALVAAVAMLDASVIVMDVTKRDPPLASMDLLIARSDVASLTRITAEYPHTVHVPLLDNRRTVVHRAAEQGKNDVLEVLLSARVPFILSLDADGLTAIDLAMARNLKTTVALLLRRAVDPPLPLHPSNAFALTRVVPKLILKWPDLATDLLRRLDTVSAPPLSSSLLDMYPCMPWSQHAANIAAAGEHYRTSSWKAQQQQRHNTQTLTAGLDEGDMLVRANGELNSTAQVWRDLIEAQESLQGGESADNAESGGGPLGADDGDEGGAAIALDEVLDDVTDDLSVHAMERRVPVLPCIVPLPFILGSDARYQVSGHPASSGLGGSSRLQHRLSRVSPGSLDAHSPQGFSHIGKRALTNSLLHVAARSNYEELFQTRIMEAVMQHKWASFGKRKFLFDLVFYAVFVGLYTAVTAVSVGKGITCQSSAYADDPGNGGDSPDYRGATGKVTLAFEVLMLLMAAWLFVVELVQMAKERLHYFSSLWNIIELAALCLVFAAVPLRALCVDAEPSLTSVATLLLWFRLLSFARGFKQTGVFVRMLFTIAKDLVFFFGILLLAILSFAHAFFLLGGGADDTGFGTWGTAVLNVYQMMFGSFDTEQLAYSTYPGLSRTLWGIFMVFVVIILLNVLIALLSNTFQRTMENAAVQWRMELASILIEYELGMTPKERAAHAPKWLHYAVTAADAQSNIRGGASSDDEGEAVETAKHREHVTRALESLSARIDQTSDALHALSRRMVKASE